MKTKPGNPVKYPVARMLSILIMIIMLAILPACDQIGKSGESEKINILFSQEAESGSLIRETGEIYTLTLNNISDITIAFADRPVRKAYLVDTASFMGMFDKIFEDNPPNAVLNFRSKAEGAPINIAVFIISEPIYDEISKTLIYKAVDIPLDGDKEGVSSEGGVLTSLPAEFGDASLFIDPSDPILNTDNFFEQDIEGVTSATVCLTGNPKDGYQFYIGDDCQ